MTATALLRRGVSEEFVPPQSALVRTWVRPDGLGAFANNDQIGSWADNGSENKALIQTTAANQPLAKTGVLNGLTVAQFDGVNDALQTAAYSSIAQPTTIITVARYLVLGGNQYFHDGRALNTQALGNASSSNYMIYAGAIIFNGAQDTSWHIFVSIFDGATSNIRVNGGAGVAGNAGLNTLSGLTLGAAGDLSGAAPLNGQVAEISVTAAHLTVVEINQWIGYLNTKTALSCPAAT